VPPLTGYGLLIAVLGIPIPVVNANVSINGGKMVCPMSCFCAFYEAKTPERRAAIVKQYKKQASASAKGMSVYYRPALQIIRGTLCPNGTLDEKLAALRQACIRPTSTDKLNDARIVANALVYRAFRDEFGTKQLNIFSNPRMQFLASTDVAINLQPELYAEIDGAIMMWKFGMSKKTPKEPTIRAILQMLTRATKHKGLDIPIDQIRFLDVRTGKIYAEATADASLDRHLKKIAQDLADAWDKAA
jgi:hypothetical protein